MGRGEGAHRWCGLSACGLRLSLSAEDERRRRGGAEWDWVACGACCSLGWREWVWADERAKAASAARGRGEEEGLPGRGERGEGDAG